MQRNKIEYKKLDDFMNKTTQQFFILAILICIGSGMYAAQTQAASTKNIQSQQPLSADDWIRLIKREEIRRAVEKDLAERKKARAGQTNAQLLEKQEDFAVNLKQRYGERSQEYRRALDQIHTAIEEEKPIIKELLAQGNWKHDEIINCLGQTPVMIAAWEGSLASLKHCLEECSPDLHKKDYKGCSLLMFILAIGNEKIFNYFIDYLKGLFLAKKISAKEFVELLNAPDKTGVTPLRALFEFAQKDLSADVKKRTGSDEYMFDALLRLGARTMDPDKNGVTVIQRVTAVGGKMSDILNRFIDDRKKVKEGAKNSGEGSDFIRKLEHDLQNEFDAIYEQIGMAIKNEEPIINKILAKSLWTHDQIIDIYQRTPVMLAAMQGSLKMVQHCLEDCGADFTKNDIQRNSLLMVIVSSGDEDVFNYYIGYLGQKLNEKELEEEIDRQNGFGDTSLRIALEYVYVDRQFSLLKKRTGNAFMFNALLGLGADYTCAGNDGLGVQRRAEALGGQMLADLNAFIAANPDKVKKQREKDVIDEAYMDGIKKLSDTARSMLKTNALKVLSLPERAQFQANIDACITPEDAEWLTLNLIASYSRNVLSPEGRKKIIALAHSVDTQKRLFLAIIDNDEETFKNLLNPDNHDECTNELGRTPMMLAGLCGRVEMTKYCLQNCKYDLTKQDKQGHSLLALIVLSDNRELFDYFIDDHLLKKVEAGELTKNKFSEIIDQKNNVHFTSLRLAAEDMLKQPTGFDNVSSMKAAKCKRGNVHMVTRLLAHGANYELVDVSGITMTSRAQQLAEDATNPFGAQIKAAVDAQVKKDEEKRKKEAEDFEKFLQDSDEQKINVLNSSPSKNKKQKQLKLLAAKKAEKLKQEEAEKERIKREAQEQVQATKMLKLAAAKKEQEEAERALRAKEATEQREKEQEVIAKNWYEVRQKSAALKQWKDTYAARITFLTELEKKALAAQAQKIEEERAAKAELERLETERQEKEAQELARRESARLEQIAHELKLKKDAEQAHKKQQEELAAQAQIHTMAQPPIQYVQMPQPLQQVVQYVAPTAFIQQQLKPHEALFNAVRAGDQAGADFLVMQGIPVDIRDAGGKTALMLAAEKNNVALQNRLIACRADVNASSRLNKTAAILAAQEGHFDTLRNLSAGNFNIDFNVRDNSRKNVVDYLVGHFKELRYHFDEKEEALNQQNKVMSQKDEIIEKQRLEIEQLKHMNATQNLYN